MTTSLLRSPLLRALSQPVTAVQRYATGVACALLALALHWLLLPVAGGRFPFLFFVPMLIVAASVAGQGPGLLVVAIATVNGAFMLPPIGTFRIASWRDQVMVAVFALIGWVLVHFGSRYRLIGHKAAEAERRLHVAQDAVGVGVFELDYRAQKILCSATLWKLMGRSPQADWVTVEAWRAPIHADDLQHCLDVMQRNIAASLPYYECEYRIQHEASGEIRKVLSRVHIERDGGGNVVYLRGATADISHRRQLEAALVEADRRKDEFLATLAHELRNPLAPIRQAAAIFKSPAATDEQKRWGQEIIERQVKHMALLLDDLLDVSRITRGVLELRRTSVELAAVVSAAIDMARELIDARQHRLTVSLPEKPVWVHADGVRLCQVLTNLLTNAARFTEPGGALHLVADCEGEQLVIRVRDNGAGISAEELPGIFRMFVRGQSRRLSDGGLGIGLALTKGIVELHGGSVEARSAGPGMGSEFTVRLPLGDATPDMPADAASVAAVSLVTRRVLIVDDNRDAADSLAAVLRVYGHEALTAYDGEEGLRTFLDFRPEFAVLDIGMPTISGYDLAERIRQLPSDRRITLIAATGWGQEDDRRRSALAGFDHHLTKPIDLERLTAILRGRSGTRG